VIPRRRSEQRRKLKDLSVNGHCITLTLFLVRRRTEPKGVVLSPLHARCTYDVFISLVLLNEKVAWNVHQSEGNNSGGRLGVTPKIQTLEIT
jgi:hypothetical protein